MSTSNVAPGWTNDQDDLSDDYYWSPSGPGTLMAATYGLENCKGLLRNTARGGGDFYIFRSGSEGLYLWNLTESSVWHITTPSDLAGVTASLKTKTGSTDALTMTELVPAAPAAPAA